MTVVLGAAEIGAVIGAVNVVEAVEAIHADLGSGTMRQPPPVALTGSDDAIFLPMAVRSDRLGLVAVKLMADIPENGERGLPTQRSTILVSSSVTGECIAVLDGMAITRRRTAAASVVATRHLARPDSRHSASSVRGTSRSSTRGRSPPRDRSTGSCSGRALRPRSIDSCRRSAEIFPGDASSPRGRRKSSRNPTCSAR